MKSIKVTRSSVGTKAEIDELLAIASRGDITIIFREYDLQNLGKVLKLVEQNKVAGMAVVKIPE